MNSDSLLVLQLINFPPTSQLTQFPFLSLPDGLRIPPMVWMSDYTMPMIIRGFFHSGLCSVLDLR